MRIDISIGKNVVLLIEHLDGFWECGIILKHSYKTGSVEVDVRGDATYVTPASCIPSQVPVGVKPTSARPDSTAWTTAVAL